MDCHHVLHSYLILALLFCCFVADQMKNGADVVCWPCYPPEGIFAGCVPRVQMNDLYFVSMSMTPVRTTSRVKV